MESLTSEKTQKSAVKSTKKMRSALITAPGQVELQTVSLPEPKADEVRIKLEGSGVCASNLPLWEGRDWFSYPAEAGSPGHEGWGIVDAIGEEVSHLKIGDRVTGLSYHAYAEYDLAKANELVKLPDDLNGFPFPGEALGCAMNIFSRSDIRPGQTVAIVGAGFLGLLLIQLAKAEGARVIAVSSRKFSLHSAVREGADHIVEMDDHFEIIKKVKALTEANFCERVIEATGVEWPLNLACELTSVRGKLIVAGFHQDGMRKINMQLLNWRGIDMINAHERNSQQYLVGIRNAIKAIREKRIDPFPLFTHSFLLKNVEKAFTYLAERPEGFIKALIINK